MSRRCLAFVLLVATSIEARDKLADTKEALAALETGAMSATQVANRISFAGTEAQATDALAFSLRQVIDERKRGLYFDVLAQIATPHPDLVAPATAAATGAQDITLRMNGLRVLGRVRSPSSVKVVAGLLGDRALGVRREATKALVLLKNSTVSGELLTAAKIEDDPETRAAMLIAVGKLGDAKRAGAIEPFLTSSSETTRLAATQALCLLGHKKGTEAVKALLVSADALLRVQGVLLLEGVPLKTSSPLLTPMLKDPVVSVRAKAGRVLAQAGDVKAIDWLVIESFKSPTDDRLVFEPEIEPLRLADDQRAAILRKAGLTK